MDDKTKSIVAHITLLGWIIALVMNQSEKGVNASFYLRQCIGLYLMVVTGSLISLFGLGIVTIIIYVITFVLWVISIIGAAGNEQKPVPVVGDMFQQWFKGIS